jgi:hypothetical protein
MLTWIVDESRELFKLFGGKARDGGCLGRVLGQVLVEVFGVNPELDACDAEPFLCVVGVPDLALVWTRSSVNCWILVLYSTRFPAHAGKLLPTGRRLL